MIKFNLNHYVRVKLTERGRLLHREDHDRFSGVYVPPIEDADGWSRWQLWRLMETFGPYIHIGFDPPFETDIELEEEAA